MLECERVRALLVASDFERTRVAKPGRPLNVGDLSLLRQLPETAGELVDDLRLERAELVDVDFRRAEGNAPRFGMARFAQDVGDMQQRLRWNAAAIETHAAGIDRRVDQRDLH